MTHLPVTWPAAAAIALCVVVATPVFDGILYRGLLWGALEQLQLRQWAVFAITTITYTVVYLEFFQLPQLVLIAVVTGVARLATGGLLASIVAHAVHNLLPGVALFLLLIGVELSP